jgi:hypothetical protein
MVYERKVAFRTIGLQPCYDASDSVSVARSHNTNKKSPASKAGLLASLSKGKTNEIFTSHGESPHTPIIEDKDSPQKPAHPGIRAAHTAYPDKP